jgi:hypothetical protein
LLHTSIITIFRHPRSCNTKLVSHPYIESPPATFAAYTNSRATGLVGLISISFPRPWSSYMGAGMAGSSISERTKSWCSSARVDWFLFALSALRHLCVSMHAKMKSTKCRTLFHNSQSAMILPRIPSGEVGCYAYHTKHVKMTPPSSRPPICLSTCHKSGPASSSTLLCQNSNRPRPAEKVTAGTRPPQTRKSTMRGTSGLIVIFR